MRSLVAGRGRRLLLDVAAIGGAAAVAVVAFSFVGRDLGQPPLPRPVEPLLPDLVMAPIATVGVGERTDEGRIPLRFSATIANIGEGDFVAEAERSWPWSDDWTVRQRIQDTTGGYSVAETGAGLVFGGDGHGHWHIRAVEAHRLEDASSGEVVAELEKIGFCFFDTHVVDDDLPGSPAEARYEGSACEGLVTTGQVVGLSVGWGDIYPFGLPEQQLWIEDVPAGRYRLVQVADPDDHFREMDEGNNETWLDLELSWEDGAAVVSRRGGVRGVGVD